MAACLALVLVTTSCSSNQTPTDGSAAVAVVAEAEPVDQSTTPPTTSPSTTAAPTTSLTTTTLTTTTTTTTTTLLGRPTKTALGVFGFAGDVPLRYPAQQVAVIGFHESSHDGSQQIDVTEPPTPILTMETRERGTGSRTAADIAVAPGTPIFSPVAGTVLRAGTYTLYCDHTDDFVVIEPDDRPGWEVKVFHIVDVQVSAGQRVEAGATLLAPEARMLPFESQVDEFSAAPPWPHVHVEVIDPSIPDRPSGGSC